MINENQKVCHRQICVPLVLMALFSIGSVQAQEKINNFGAAVSAALVTNPAVVSAYYDFEAAREGQRSAEGGFYPSVDLDADYAWEERETPLNDFGDYERDSVRFSVTQLLFDGFQTRDRARSLGYEKLARYYDVHGAAQSIAFDASVAYSNTVLYQDLVKFAGENFDVHKAVYSKIQERAAAGRDEGVNLDQAKSRLALAESNLLTERTNLYDTISEFQRIVGALPGDNLPMPVLPNGVMPGLRNDALKAAYNSSPEINRTIEEVRAAREALNATRGPMYPRLDLRYRNEQESNIDGFRGDYDLQAVELVFTYNLFRGGSDSARRREFSNRYYSAVEDRKQACLSVRREVTIAFNNVRALKEQVRYLTIQSEAQDKTRRAYNDQFDLNQRSLLDLLDSQNEYFDTQRALASAKINLLQAQARVLAEIGMLTDALDAQGFNSDKIEALDLDLVRRDDEQIAVCDSGVVPEMTIVQDLSLEAEPMVFTTADSMANMVADPKPAVAVVAAPKSPVTAAPMKTLVIAPEPDAYISRQSAYEGVGADGANWFINIATYADIDWAERWKASLSDEGYPAVIIPFEKNGVTLHRIRVVGYVDEREAKSDAILIENALETGPLWVGNISEV
ncbi:MAG: TolC family outer membrane protein [Luminiphilus sp.]|nr:TolC family outer membrane protein [Luminiphilus sp.]MDG1461518.1 TolC family outer membrane protein [Luminiphilus sp.]